MSHQENTHHERKALLEQSKSEALNSFPEACRQQGKLFVDCLEFRAQDAKNLNYDEVEYERYMSGTGLPRCLDESNLEACLKNN